MTSIPLRLRLLAGAGLIAGSAILAALLAAWGSAETARLIGEDTAAQTRLDLLAQVSARVGDYALVAVDSGAGGLPPAERAGRLDARAVVVRDAFDALGTAYAGSVAEAETMGRMVQMRRATRGIGLARMRANFEALARATPELPDIEALRASLDGFARLFAPLLNEAIESERRESARAAAALDVLRSRMQALAIVVSLVAAALLALYHQALVRPLLARLDRVSRAAEAVGRGGFDQTPPVDRRDELGLVFAQINRMAARLGRGRRALERDRADLAATVAERTAALTAANARLEAVDAERRRFFADVGHELRTPLTVILAETDLAARAGALTEAEFREALGVIGARARRLNRRIDDLLRVARSESGQIELDDAPFDLGRATEDAVADVATLVRRAKVRVDAHLASAATARGDRDWSRQVIAGLIENATRHSYEGGVILIALGSRDGMLTLSVTDEGGGVPPDQQGRVFERHVRGRTTGLGFGVGLALARWIMERQGGRIDLISPAPNGRGTLVTLRFVEAGE